MPDAPDASVKLRTVLDYVPCEACLAQPVKDQDLLCSICARLDRQVGVRVSLRRTVILERPTEPGPVVIQPPSPAAPSVDDVDVVLVRAGEAVPEPRPGSTQIVLEPLEETPAVAAAPPPLAEEPELEWDDVVSWTAPDDAFEYVAPSREAAPPPPPPPPEPVPEDEYVFAPPPAEPEPAAEEVVEATEDWMPLEEVRVEPETPAEAALEETWAPRAEPPLEEARAPPPEEAEEPILESTLVEEEPILESTVVEDDVVETTVVEDEVVEMEVVEDDAPAAPLAPAAAAAPSAAGGRIDSDLWKLRGFDRTAQEGLRGANITEVQHLAGHDPVELAPRAGVPADRLAPWIQVADLVHEAGVPLESAVALVAAGVAGPRGLRDMDAETIVDRVGAFAGARIAPQDVKRWKRRV